MTCFRNEAGHFPLNSNELLYREDKNMTFKEFKKQRDLNSRSVFAITYDWDIYCDMAERAGYDPTDLRMQDYYGGHQGYLEDSNDIYMWNNSEPVPITDANFGKLEQFTNEAFLREYFFDNYTVESVQENDEYGLVVKLVHE